MKVRQGPARAALLSTAATALLTLVAVAPASAAATPPYEPDAGAAGAVVFYDAAGSVITSGSTSTRVSYAVGTASLTSTGSKASLYGYLPKSGQVPGAFSGELLAGPTTYPIAGSPAAVSSSPNPAVKTVSGDLSFADLAADFPNTATDAYQGLYQIRVKTSDPKYLATDIQITGSTWTQVYPAPAVATAPGAPTIGTATGGPSSASVAFTAPASDGGSAITGYTVTSTPGGVTATGTTSPITVAGLTNGTAYTFTVHATNAVGSSAESAASNSATPTAAPTAPGAPTIGTATAGSTTASVAFTAPSNTGGSAITGYTVTSTPGGITGTGASSPISVAGLTNGTAYTFTVTATNAIGTGAASAASNSVTPKTVPGAPTIGAATAGNATASVAFTAPASNGGSAITGYTVTSTPGGVTATGSASPITVPGLTNGTAYTFTVHATNAAGSGTESAASNAATPMATAPGAPTIGAATAGDGQATVTFTAPASNGGSAITGYTVTSTPGNLTGTGTTSPITVAGLTNGTAYTFKVKATNAIGTGAESAASSSVTPAAVTAPGAPTIGTATAGNASATVAFTAPASNGGSAITGYTVTSSPGGVTKTGTSSPITVTGLTNGTAYTFTVKATNAIGTGAASAASNAVTPTAVTTTLGLLAPTSTPAGTIFRVEGTLGGGTVSGQTVTLTIKTAGRNTRTANVTTDSSGDFSYAIKGYFTTKVTAAFQATPQQSGATSAQVTTVVNLAVKVLAPSNGTVCSRTCTIAFRGVCTPATDGSGVGAYLKVGSRYVLISRGRMHSDGSFLLAHTFMHGTYTMHIGAYANATNGSGSSKDFTLTVK